jgi:hypothetical protein
MNIPDPTERALALQDTFEGAIKGPDHHAGARRDSGDHDKEAYLVRRAATPARRPSFDLQKQRDKFALAMGVGLGEDRFQLIARRLP